jgi:hypothetical protein
MNVIKMGFLGCFGWVTERQNTKLLSFNFREHPMFYAFQSFGGVSGHLFGDDLLMF